MDFDYARSAELPRPRLPKGPNGVFSMAEVAPHTSRESCYIVADGRCVASCCLLHRAPAARVEMSRSHVVCCTGAVPCRRGRVGFVRAALAARLLWLLWRYRCVRRRQEARSMQSRQRGPRVLSGRCARVVNANHLHPSPCRVFDVTEWLDLHPAGSACLLKHAGAQDCTVDFKFHSPAARAFWAHYQIGYLEGHEPGPGCVIL